MDNNNTEHATNIKNIVDHLKSKKAYWYWSIIGLTLVSVILIFFINANIFPLNILRELSGILLVTLLPGYVIMRLLFPKREEKSNSQNLENLKLIERIGLSLVVSIVIVSLLAIFLNYLLGEHNLEFLAITIVSINIITSTFTVFLEYQQR